jgi:adenylylsulfate kinase
MNSTPEACEKRDEKGHYLKARQGEFSNFPGVDIDYEETPKPEIVIDIDIVSIDDAVNQIVNYLKRNILNN